MRVRGIPAVLAVITAALTLVPVVQYHRSYPQAHPQIVDAASTTPRLDWTERASRSRVDPPPKVKPTLKTLKPINLGGAVVARHPRSTETRKRPVRANVRTFVSRGTSVEAWANSADGIKVANCESGDRGSWSHYNGNAHLRDNASYRGKWQMGFSEWRGTGGTGDPADASESEQDYRAHILFMARGWQPWSCSRIMGVG